MMTVADLKKLVAALPDHQNDMLVFLAIDEEGNGFKPMYGTSVKHFNIETHHYPPPNEHVTWTTYDEVYVEEGEDYSGPGTCQALVLWP